MSVPAGLLQERDNLLQVLKQGSASLFLIVAEMRGQERQAAEELGQWKTHHEERKVIDASAAAITLAMPVDGDFARGIGR